MLAENLTDAKWISGEAEATKQIVCQNDKVFPQHAGLSMPALLISSFEISMPPQAQV